jgi:RNA polymerase sigma-70 factor (ECF subfamily)
MSLALALTLTNGATEPQHERFQPDSGRRYSGARGIPALTPQPNPPSERPGGPNRHSEPGRSEAPEIDWPALVRRCLDGDATAWADLVAGQQRRVYSLCYRFTASSPDAEDLTQDVFIKLYANLRSFDVAKGSFQTWITTLTRNMLVDNYRRTKLDRATDSMDATLSADDDGPTLADRLADTRQNQEQRFAGLELKATIQNALKKLSPELREAVILRDLEDMDYKEIAIVLKIPEGTVKSRISRGRAELARLLQRIDKQSN